MSGKSRMGRKTTPKPVMKVRKHEVHADFKLAVGMAVYNETEKVQEWLDRHPFVKRLILIDQGSTDGTAEVANDSRVQYIKVGRFEENREINYSLFPKMVGPDGLIVMTPYESITEEMFAKLEERVISTYKNYGITAFFIARKHFVDGQCTNHLYVLQSDTDGKNWQMRISLGDGIKWPTAVHQQGVPTGKFGYIHDDVYITREVTIAEERSLIENRATQTHITGRDLDKRYLMALEKMAKQKEAQDA